MHVGFDPDTGEFSGLPDTWARILQNADISLNERKKNPKKLLEVINFFQETQKLGARQEPKYLQRHPTSLSTYPGKLKKMFSYRK